MALTQDIQVLRIGAEGLNEPISAPLGANVTVYSGSIALLANTGYLKNAASPASTDVVVGIINNPSGGTYVQTGPGIAAGTTNGAVWIDCLTGTFLLKSGTSGDALTEANAGQIVYVIDEQTVGATSGGGTRPPAGVMLPIDPTMPSGYVPVKLSNPAG